ncbi:DUF1203 domain-containing protein [Cochlodiniinecator piscidefendens]|uniref:DUF1203 domain-containing protein n=1 Tax=Cochlodiniinecator piscidefendens TaxID=2715756 RepID=UPI00140A6138|nr:DUF1203 domain-containing protein [Cochlodiniinecator piscidefendens]
MNLAYHPYNQAFVDQVRTGGFDDNGQVAECDVSDGHGNPCRSCLKEILKDAKMLILGARPFSELQPYAELGPIFLCADACTPHDATRFPDILNAGSDYLLKGYTENNRILYGTGQIVPCEEIESTCITLFENPNVAFVDVRSSRNNCFQLRIKRQ